MSTLPSQYARVNRGGSFEFLPPEFQIIIDSLTEGVGVADSEGAIVFVNTRFLDITGYTREEILGRRMHEVFYPDGTPELGPEARRMGERYEERRKGVSEIYEAHIYRKDGKRRWVEIKGGPLFDQDGNITGSIGALSDITEKKHLEEQVRWSQKMDALGRLAGGVAHDFNNLLTVIQGYADLLRQQLGAENPHTRKIDVIREATDAASALTQQLLSISRRQIAQMQDVIVNSVIERSLRVIQGLLGERINLLLDLYPELPAFRGDPSQIQQILLNLIVNARDAMPDGGSLLVQTTLVDFGGVPVETARDSYAGCFVRLRVKDTGRGMDQQIKARIFEPFFTTKDGCIGSGLGLSVTYGIIEEHGAEIRVTSEPGEGSTFDVLFPATRYIAPEGWISTDWKSLTGTETILVAEDHIAVRVLLKETLERYGYNIIEADDGREALDQFLDGENKIDLLITDIVMPRMGGLDLAKRAKEFSPSLKVIVISGYADDSASWQNIRESGYSFLSKPFSPDTIARLTRTVLDEGAQIAIPR